MSSWLAFLNNWSSIYTRSKVMNKGLGACAEFSVFCDEIRTQKRSSNKEDREYDQDSDNENSSELGLLGILDTSKELIFFDRSSAWSSIKLKKDFLNMWFHFLSFTCIATFLLYFVEGK